MSYSLSPVVASIGRSGSGILRTSISNCGITARKPDITSIEQAIPGTVCKTHIYPPKTHPKHVRLIFTFANPVDIVFSLVNIHQNQGPTFFNAHKVHLGAPNAQYDKLFDEDVLGLERMFNAYMAVEDYPIIMVKYPNMFNSEAEISEFIEHDMKMEKERPRGWAIDSFENGPTKRARIEKAYRSLREKVEAMPSVSIRNEWSDVSTI